MVLRLEEISEICRLCLRRGDLTNLSETMSSGALAIEDVMHHTGIELFENEGVPYAICNECRQIITISINFRRACSRNDIIFKKLVAVLHGLAKDNAVRQESEDGVASIAIHGDSQHNIGETGSKEEARSETPIITLDDSDSDNCLPAEPGYDSDTNDSIASLYTEMLQETSHQTYDYFFTHSNAPSRKRPTEDSMQPMSLVSEEEEKETELSTIESNLKSRDDSDSNDSLPSLYGEVMAKSVKSRRQKANTANSVDPNGEVKRKESSRLCPICGITTDNVNTHMKKRHDKTKQFICLHCSKLCPTRMALNQHINTWHDKHIILSCDQCGRGFTNHNSHYYHMKNSHGESDVYECETCHRKLKSYDGYKKHLKEHSLTCFPCPDCDKLFKTSVTLEKHRLRYHAS